MHSKKNSILFKRSIIYIVVYTFVALILTRFTYAFGSHLDWPSQHFAFPDYFRKRFYETGEIFPSFAPNIGGGENIYNFSYYGLFSPIILISYLLPFVPMHIYIQAVSFIGVIVSVILFYYWISKKTDNEQNAFVLGIVFLFAAPVIFHSHRHIMFTGYMPFLLLTFMAVDDYFAGKKKYKLVLFSFLTIMCCYFFAITALCSITIYGIYKYLTVTQKVTLKDFLHKGTHFAGRLITAAMMSGVLIIPTLFCMLNGRDKGNTSAITLKTFLPGIQLNTFMFDSYSMGVGVFVIAAIICAVMCKNKSRRFLGITMAVFGIFPIFVYALNGFLYFDGKVMIAFLPLCVMLMGQALEDLQNNRFAYKIVLPITALYIVLGILLSEKCKQYVIGFAIIDLIVICICLYFYNKKSRKILTYIPLCGVLVLGTVSINFGDKLHPLEKINEAYSKDVRRLSAYAGKHDEFVRTANYVGSDNSENYIYNMKFYSSNIYSSLHNKDYNNFYLHEIRNENALRNPALTIQSKNLISNMYMSEKYLIAKSSDTVPAGYKIVETSGDYVLYENENVLPWGYVSHETISYEDYKKTEYPQSVLTLLEKTVTEEKTENSSDAEPELKEINAPQLFIGKGITFKDGSYTFKTNKNITNTVKLPEALGRDEMLFISFDVDNSKEDASYFDITDTTITINGIKNKLTNPKWKYHNKNYTFEYTLTTNGNEALENLDITAEKGTYRINNVRMYTAKIPDVKNNIDPFICNTSKTKGDVICGSVNAASDGIFNISIPYADGFTIKVDGEKVDYQKVDTAFLGFKINKGSHNIEISFEAPGLKYGKIISLTGFVIFAVLFAVEFIKRKKYNKIH